MRRRRSTAWEGESLPSPTSRKSAWSCSAFTGETLRYEFFYEPGKSHGYPSLGRLAFVLEPDGVRLRWLSERPTEDWTGLAIANPSQAPVNVNFELRRLDGSSTGLSASVTIPSGGQIARFANELLSGFPPAFQGILRLTATSPVTVTSLRGRYNERGDFLITTSPPWNEASNSTTQMLFPHIASGAGYATQFILFAGGQSATGSLNFFTRDGAPMSDMNLAPIP